LSPLAGYGQDDIATGANIITGIGLVKYEPHTTIRDKLSPNNDDASLLTCSSWLSCSACVQWG
jgi:hypothetical protein